MEAERVRRAIGKLVDKLTIAVLRYVKDTARNGVQHPRLVEPGKTGESLSAGVPTAHLW